MNSFTTYSGSITFVGDDFAISGNGPIDWASWAIAMAKASLHKGTHKRAGLYCDLAAGYLREARGK